MIETKNIGFLLKATYQHSAIPASFAQAPLHSLEPRRHTSCMAPCALRLLKEG